ncbi:hypothetical protein HO173_000808 [Letharia columbiana]|uniref:C2H2-type domain-containing protein n=1 Tax=Letharia columbiana TaxID=112416 RepID=A0A8H6G5L7_9LECA|nr:uncharacterized protein HO173_000808 [Letharia columbiana]KAF6241014.1 hypothetical protein HO173_000808 [Letharia columbiana]
MSPSPPPQASRTSPINAQSATSSPPTSPSNPFNGGSTHAPHTLTGPMSGPIENNSNNPTDSVSKQEHDLSYISEKYLQEAIKAGYYRGRAPHLEQQMYGNPQPAQLSEKPFKCDQCPQSFKHNRDLERHQRTHLKRPFECDQCFRSYKRNHDLRRHQRTHLERPERPFKCDQCAQSFKRNHDLKRHQRTHLKVDLFTCPVCEKSFSRKDVLQRHLRDIDCDKSTASSETATEWT